MGGEKKNKKNNPNLNYENLKPNGMECVIRIFMSFALLFWSQFNIVTVINKNSGFLNRIFQQRWDHSFSLMSFRCGRHLVNDVSSNILTMSRPFTWKKKLTLYTHGKKPTVYSTSLRTIKNGHHLCFCCSYWRFVFN